MKLAPNDRVVVIAPHPDDESVGTGGLIQHALAAGASVRVVFFTRGENNTWAQRAGELRWRIGAADRERFAGARRLETAAAVAVLGLRESDCFHLGYPDLGTTGLLLGAGREAVDAIARHVADWRPTLVAAPSLLDLHPDHSALAVLVRLAVDAAGHAAPAPPIFAYVVHNPAVRSARLDWVDIALTPDEQRRKREAILCHRTQLVLRRYWMPSFATPVERYLPGAREDKLPIHCIEGATRRGGHIAVEVHTRARLRAYGRRQLFLVVRDPDGVVRRLHTQVPSSPRAVAVLDLADGNTVGEARFAGGLRGGTLELPATLIPAGARVFAKIERRFGFFDEAGWRELVTESTPAA